MTFGALIVLLLIVGIVMARIPIDATVKNIILALLLIGAVVVVAAWLGVVDFGTARIHIG